VGAVRSRVTRSKTVLRPLQEEKKRTKREVIARVGVNHFVNYRKPKTVKTVTLSTIHDRGEAIAGAQ